MKGTNKIAKLCRDSGEMLQVREVLATIQGEGPYSGMRAVFIRMTGCHLACVFCDTVWNDDTDPWSDVETLADQACAVWEASFPAARDDMPLFVLTGGEPLRQNVTLLIERILEKMPDARIQIETAGSFWRDILQHTSVSVVVSPKTAFVHPRLSSIANAYKYVIRATDALHPEFGTPLSSTQGEQELVRIATPPPCLMRRDIYLSPCDEGDEYKNAANRQAALKIAMQYGYRLQLQIHTWYEVP